MFLTYWLFNTYFFPKQQAQTNQTSTKEEVKQAKEVLSKPIITLTNEGILIFSDYEDGQIRFNFDGNEPTVNDNLYQEIIPVTDPDQVTKLRAKLISFRQVILNLL
jgi:hypothetical protein